MVVDALVLNMWLCALTRVTHGTSRELYGRYTGLEPAIAVSRAVALGILSEAEVGAELLKKLEREILVFREHG
jgi:hypothetical protein